MAKYPQVSAEDDEYIEDEDGDDGDWDRSDEDGYMKGDGHSDQDYDKEFEIVSRPDRQDPEYA